MSKQNNKSTANERSGKAMRTKAPTPQQIQYVEFLRKMEALNLPPLDVTSLSRRSPTMKRTMVALNISKSAKQPKHRTPKFRKAKPGEAQRSVENYHAILAKLAKYEMPAFDAVEMKRKDYEERFGPDA